MSNAELLNAKMTAIADEIRELSGSKSALGLDVMASGIREANSEIVLQEQLIEQAISALEDKVSPSLYEQGYQDGYVDGEESRYSIEDALVAKTIAEYHNPRPVTIGNRFFSYCYNLVSIDLPNAVVIGDYAFVYCTALEELSLPSVTSIAAFAFQNCTNLTVVDLGAANALQSNVFTSTNISKLILRKTDTITTNNSTAVFNNTPMARGEGFIFVPDHLVEDYKSATNWSVYAAQIKPLSELEG